MIQVIVFLTLLVIALLLILLAILENGKKKLKGILAGCLYTRWGCCHDKITTRLDPWGSNCLLYKQKSRA